MTAAVVSCCCSWWWWWGWCKELNRVWAGGGAGGQVVGAGEWLFVIWEVVCVVFGGGADLGLVVWIGGIAAFRH